MPKRKIIFENLVPYHIINRGVDKRKIFRSEDDYNRFIYQIYAANFGAANNGLSRKIIAELAETILQGGKMPPKAIIQSHPPFVYILAFALMSNHIHFALVQGAKNGISQFMHRLEGGFVRYFNFKYGRKGILFEGRFKAIVVKDDAQIDALTRYINVNPLSVFKSNWKERGISDWNGALNFLSRYKWSSYSDFIGKRHSHLMPPWEIMKMFYGDDRAEGAEEYKKFIEAYLDDKLGVLNTLVPA